MRQIKMHQLNKVLSKEKASQVAAGYYEDPYHRPTLGYLHYRRFEDNEIVSFEIRAFRYDKKRHSMLLSLVNWTRHAGSCSLDLNWMDLTEFFFSETMVD